jgi:hypothetical protein
MATSYPKPVPAPVMSTFLSVDEGDTSESYLMVE